MKKENKNDSIQIIIYILAMVIILLLFILAYSFRVSASPMRDDTVSANLTIEVVKDYVDNKTAQTGATGNVFIDYGDAILNGIDDLKGMLPDEIQAFVSPAGVASPISVQCSDFIDAYDNNDLAYFKATFNLQSTSDLSNMDDYLSKQSEYIIDSIESDILIYQCPNLSHVGDMVVNNSLNASSVRDEIFGQYVSDTGNITPIYFYRWRNGWVSTSFVDTNNDNQICVDGLVMTTGNWSDMVSNIDVYRRNGYLPQDCSICVFDFYNNGLKVNAPFYHTIQHYTTFPSYLEIWPYDTIRDEGIRCQSALFSLNNDVFLFFRSQASYLKFNNTLNKSILPYDFNLNFPNTDFSTLDFSQILKAIRDNGVLETKNTQELYKRLTDTISQGIQDLIDASKTTNELLLALLRYYDKNIVKSDDNITDILNNILSAVNNINVNLDFTDSDYDSLSDEVNQAMNNSQIKRKLENTFPFSVKRDFEHVLDYFDEDIIETNPRFVFNFDLFHDEVHDYVEFDVDLTQLPGINIFRSFFHAFIVILFNFACFKLYDKFLTWYLS